MSITSIDRARYNAIGTAASPATLTASFSDNAKVLKADGFGNMHLDIQYTPNAASTNAYLMLLVEYSNDEGTTFYSKTNVVYGTAETDVYVDGLNSAAGIPFVIPGDKTSTGGVTLKASYDFGILADHVKISVREFGQTAFGTCHVRAALMA